MCVFYGIRYSVYTVPDNFIDISLNKSSAKAPSKIATNSETWYESIHFLVYLWGVQHGEKKKRLLCQSGVGVSLFATKSRLLKLVHSRTIHHYKLHPTTWTELVWFWREAELWPEMYVELAWTHKQSRITSVPFADEGCTDSHPWFLVTSECNQNVIPWTGCLTVD